MPTKREKGIAKKTTSPTFESEREDDNVLKTYEFRFHDWIVEKRNSQRQIIIARHFKTFRKSRFLKVQVRREKKELGFRKNRLRSSVHF